MAVAQHQRVRRRKLVGDLTCKNKGQTAIFRFAKIGARCLEFGRRAGRQARQQHAFAHLRAASLSDRSVSHRLTQRRFQKVLYHQTNLPSERERETESKRVKKITLTHDRHALNRRTTIQKGIRAAPRTNQPMTASYRRLASAHNALLRFECVCSRIFRRRRRRRRRLFRYEPFMFVCVCRVE